MHETQAATAPFSSETLPPHYARISASRRPPYRLFDVTMHLQTDPRLVPPNLCLVLTQAYCQTAMPSQGKGLFLLRSHPPTPPFHLSLACPSCCELPVNRPFRIPPTHLALSPNKQAGYRPRGSGRPPPPSPALTNPRRVASPATSGPRRTQVTYQTVAYCFPSRLANGSAVHTADRRDACRSSDLETGCRRNRTVTGPPAAPRKQRDSPLA